VIDEQHPSPWSRQPPGPDDEDVTWVSPPAPRPSEAPNPPPWAPGEPPEPTTSGTGWARRSLAAIVIIGFLASFLTARLLAGPNGPLGTGSNRSPSAQFIPTDPSTGNGASSGTVPADAAAVAAKVRPGVVDINTELAFQHASAAGTGMVLTAAGQVLTNNHVVEGATSITATVVDTGKTYTATVVGTDSTDDIAVLQLTNASGLKTVTLGDSSAVRVGDDVVSLGNAGGVGGKPSVKTGTIEAIGQDVAIGNIGGRGYQQLQNLIMTTVPLQSGDSGGPLVDSDGKVIGIDTAATVDNRFRSGPARGFSIPIADAMAVVHQIESGVATDTVHIGPSAFLGVTLVSGNGRGVVVAGVASGSPAESAGLEQGDTITSAGGQAVDSADALSSVIQAHHPGDKVGLQWTDRSGDDHSTTVKLTAGPAS